MPRTRPVGVVLAESGRRVGGTERVLWELATRLPEERFAVEVWLTPDPGVDELAAALGDAGVAVRRVAEVDSRWDVAGAVRTWSALRRARPTILHIHHVWPAADRYLSEIAVWAGVPHQVVTEHIVGQSHSSGQRWLKRRELRRADAVTAVCAAVADALAQDLGAPREHFQVVPNGAGDFEPAAEAAEARRLRQEWGVGPRKPLLVAAGRLEEQKGLDVLLEALAQLPGTDQDWLLALAGQGSWREPLERRGAELGIAGRLRWLGQLEDAGPLMAAADVFVLPSRWEGLPLSLLEAMARGRAVVASAVGGVPEVVVDEDNGVLVPAEDPKALAAALARLLRAPDLRVRLGDEAQDTVRRRFTWAKVVDEFEAVYDEVLGLVGVEAEAGKEPPRRGRPPASRGARR